jgi:hypothetical protein
MLSSLAGFGRGDVVAIRSGDSLMLPAVERFTLSADAAWAIALVLVVAGSLLLRRRAAGNRTAAVGLFLREVGVVMALYGLWMFLGSRTGTSAQGAYSRAQDVLAVERAVHLDIEAPLQRGILGLHGLVQFANIFYATAHFLGMMAFLSWAFTRQRAAYPGVRIRVVLVTLISLSIQLMPLAPPRLLAGSGLVDTPLRYHSSVYADGFPQVSAMPSVHAAWAVLIAWEVMRLSGSRHRGWIVLHPLLTMWVVMVTGNHWLFDGLAGAAIVVVVEVLCAVPARVRAGKAQRPVSADVTRRQPELV